MTERIGFLLLALTMCLDLFVVRRLSWSVEPFKPNGWWCPARAVSAGFLVIYCLFACVVTIPYMVANR